MNESCSGKCILCRDYGKQCFHLDGDDGFRKCNDETLRSRLDKATDADGVTLCLELGISIENINIRLPDVEPYYRDSNVTIYNCNCLTILDKLTGVDALISDPPYGINYSHGTEGGNRSNSTRFANVKIIGDDRPFNPAPFLQYKKIVLWGANHYADKLPTKPGWIVWDKRVGEYGNDQSDCELAWTNFLTVARIHRQVWNGMITAGLQSGKRRVHPTQKPIELMIYCIKAADAKIILDPFAGSGTTGIAAKMLNRQAVLIEIDEAYCEIAAERIRSI